MQLSKAGEALLKGFEQLHLTAYNDDGSAKGVWTIGWGSTSGVTEGLVITLAQAQARFIRETGIAVDFLNKELPGKLLQCEFDATVSLIFNVGVAEFEKSFMFSYLKSGHMLQAAQEMWSFDHTSGELSKGLMNRRAREVLYFNGATV